MDNILSFNELKKYIEKKKYMVVFPDKSIKLYNSLRNIEKDINVSSSGISKKIKEKSFCYCKAKGTDYNYYIKLI
jgi:hypothetical protein